MKTFMGSLMSIGGAYIYMNYSEGYMYGMATILLIIGYDLYMGKNNG